MKILLIDVDSTIPNIALGKLSTYHKKKGDHVVFCQLGLSGKQRYVNTKIINAESFDKTYVSNIFTLNQRKYKVINCNNVEYGGVGSVGSMVRLPSEIDNLDVDYTLWPDNNKSYGFITRGCVRKCKFCFVPHIEGSLYFDKPIDKIVKHKITIFLDNNILAYENHLDVFQELVDKKIKCQFNQGLDIRLLNTKNMELLNQMRYYEKYIFAFDNISYMKAVQRGIKLFKTYINKNWRMTFLTYYSDKEPLCDLLTRVLYLKEQKCLPYLMYDYNYIHSLRRDFLIDFRGWVNSMNAHFCTMSFPQFLYQNRKDKSRIKSNIHIYSQAKKGCI